MPFTKSTSEVLPIIYASSGSIKLAKQYISDYVKLLFNSIKHMHEPIKPDVTVDDDTIFQYKPTVGLNGRFLLI